MHVIHLMAEETSIIQNVVAKGSRDGLDVSCCDLIHHSNGANDATTGNGEALV